MAVTESVASRMVEDGKATMRKEWSPTMADLEDFIFSERLRREASQEAAIIAGINAGPSKRALREIVMLERLERVFRRMRPHWKRVLADIEKREARK